MPVITFLQDLFMVFKGPYERHVGKHTVNFCKRIGRHKLPEGMRQTLIMSAISADEAIAALMKVDHRRDASALDIPAVKKPNPQRVKFALRAYISAILVIFGSYKQQLLHVAGQDEQKFIDMWTEVYSYNQEDMILFNELLHRYQQNGISGISSVLCSAVEGIWEGKNTFSEQHAEFFTKNLTEDIDAILFRISKRRPGEDGILASPELPSH